MTISSELMLKNARCICALRRGVRLGDLCDFKFTKSEGCRYYIFQINIHDANLFFVSCCGSVFIDARISVTNLSKQRATERTASKWRFTLSDDISNKYNSFSTHTQSKITNCIHAHAGC